jgi:hypothetical protein
MTNPQEVAQAFVNHYYQAFDSDAGQLAGLYVSRELVSVASGFGNTLPFLCLQSHHTVRCPNSLISHVSF